MSDARPRPPAVILAAGRGNRLLPLTEHVPKCLIEVGGRTILEHQVRALELAGIEEIQVVTGHGADRVREVLDGRVDYAHNELYDKTNSFDSLGCSSLDIGPAGLLILNSDVLFHPELMRRLLDDERENVLLADTRDTFGEEEMKIVVGNAGRIERISKLIDPREAHAENLGVLHLGQAAARRMIELGRERDHDRGICWVPDGIQYLLGEFDFHVLAIGDLPWTEIDYIHDLEHAEKDIFPLLRGPLWDE